MSSASGLKVPGSILNEDTKFIEIINDGASLRLKNIQLIFCIFARHKHIWFFIRSHSSHKLDFQMRRLRQVTRQ